MIYEINKLSVDYFSKVVGESLKGCIQALTDKMWRNVYAARVSLRISSCVGIIF